MSEVETPTEEEIFPDVAPEAPPVEPVEPDEPTEEDPVPNNVD